MSKLYKKASLRDRQGNDIAQGRAFKANPRTGSVIHSNATDLVDSSGNYNAGSKKDLMEIVDGLVKLARAGEIVQDPGGFPMDDIASWNQEGHLVQAALAEKAPTAAGPFQVLGEVLTDSISETMGRMGVTNKILAQQDVAEGGTARVRIRQKDVTSWLMLSDGTRSSL